MLTVVVVTYNNEHTIERCVRSLAEAAAALDGPVHVVVHDNASQDGTREMLRRIEASEVRLSLEVRASASNVGYAAAVNSCLRGPGRVSEASYVALVNPDCFVSPDTLAQALRVAEEHPGDLASVQLLHEDGSWQPSAGKIPWPSALLRRRFLARRRGLYLNTSVMEPSELPLRVEWVHFAFVLMPLELWKTLEGFDERFWLYGEDLDFCVRAGAAGRSVWWAPGGAVVHLNMYSSKDDFTRGHLFARRGMALFLKFNGSPGQRLLFWLARPVLRIKANPRLVFSNGRRRKGPSCSPEESDSTG